MDLLRRILQFPVSLEGTRLIDLVILPIGVVTALVVCLPIVIASSALGIGLAGLLKALGAPDAIVPIPSYIGLGVGFILAFVVMLRLYRRLPRAIRVWVIPEDEVDRPS